MWNKIFFKYNSFSKKLKTFLISFKIYFLEGRSKSAFSLNSNFFFFCTHGEKIWKIRFFFCFFFQFFFCKILEYRYNIYISFCEKIIKIKKNSYRIFFFDDSHSNSLDIFMDLCIKILFCKKLTYWFSGNILLLFIISVFFFLKYFLYICI